MWEVLVRVERGARQDRARGHLGIVRPAVDHAILEVPGPLGGRGRGQLDLGIVYLMQRDDRIVDRVAEPGDDCIASFIALLAAVVGRDRVGRERAEQEVPVLQVHAAQVAIFQLTDGFDFFEVAHENLLRCGEAG